VCEHAIKELCRQYVGEPKDFEGSDWLDEREKAALAYARAIASNPREADDALWARLREHFTDDELVELGWFIGLTLGQQRWLKTLRIERGQVPRVSSAGLALTGLHVE
jgi:uncharacterized protein YciW